MKKIHIIILLLLSLIIPMNSMDTLSHQNNRRKQKIRNYEMTIPIQGKQEAVFAFMDNIENTGKHMTESSAQMMGSKLSIEWLTPHKTGLGTRYRWKGKTMGMRMDFTVEVSKWIEGQEKVWGTIGDAKMIVINGFQMYLRLSPCSELYTMATLGINYTKPKGNLLAFLLGRTYAKWCVRSMLKDTSKHFKNTK